MRLLPMIALMLMSTPALATTPAENKAASLRVFKALESGDVTVLNQIFADNGSNIVSDIVSPRNGPHATFYDAAPFIGALSNRKVDVLEILAEDDLVAVRSSLCGDHTEAPIWDVQPSGRRICGIYHNIYRFQGGKIIENFVANNARSIEQQVRGQN